MQGTSLSDLVSLTQIFLAIQYQGGMSSLIDWVSDADEFLTRRWSPSRTVDGDGRCHSGQERTVRRVEFGLVATTD